MTTEGGETFGALLRRFRQRQGFSQNALSRASDIDAAYVNRLEAARGEPLVPRPRVLERLCRALELTPVERDALYFAAGRCPPTLGELPRWEPTLAQVAGLLSSAELSADDRAEFRQVLTILVDRWRRSSWKS